METIRNPSTVSCSTTLRSGRQEHNGQILAELSRVNYESVMQRPPAQRKVDRER